MEEYAKNEMDYIRRYEAAGFDCQYRMVEGQIENLESKKRYSPSEITIFKEHRYEGMSDPSDMSILYVIESKDGCKGTVLASFGADGNDSINSFMNEVPDSNIKDDFMIPPDADDESK